MPIKEFDFLDKNFPSKQTKINLSKTNLQNITKK